MEKELVKRQLITTTIFVISLFISLFLTYNELLKFSDKEIINDSLSKKIGISNRLLVVILSISYLCINYQNNKINPSYNSKLQVMASEINLLATIIVLYVVINSNYTVTSIENPIT